MTKRPYADTSYCIQKIKRLYDYTSLCLSVLITKSPFNIQTKLTYLCQNVLLHEINVLKSNKILNIPKPKRPYECNPFLRIALVICTSHSARHLASVLRTPYEP